MVAEGDGSPQRYLGRLLGAVVAVGLLIAVISVANPSEVWRIVRATDLRTLGVAVVFSAASVMMRGIRLQFLLERGPLRFVRSTLIVAVAQAAALFAPFRTGELALPWLLSRSADRTLTSGISTLVAARTLDVATLGIWCGAAVLAVFGFNEPIALAVSVLLVAPSLLLPKLVTVLDRLAVRILAPRGARGRRWARRIHGLRREFEGLVGRPTRLLIAAVASLAMWGLHWAATWTLLASMGFRWPGGTVIVGAASAAIANLLPFNIIGNLGTLEAGWTAAFTALGVPLQTAAATGLAAHLWGLIFAALFGLVAWVALARNRSNDPEVTATASHTDRCPRNL
jgi:uncharacterized protein (TIRG00374 family)